MPTSQNCPGDIPCSHSLQSRDFSNGSKGALSIKIVQKVGFTTMISLSPNPIRKVK